MKFIIAVLLISVFSKFSISQNGFELWIDSDLDEYPRSMLLNSENDFIGIIWKSDTNRFTPKSFLFKISSNGDTNSVLINKTDTVLVLHEIINADVNPPAYLVHGIGYNADSSGSLWFSYFAKIDESLNIIWERIYKLHDVDEYTCIPDVPLLLRLKDGGFLHACFLNPHWKMYLFQMDENGDSVAYRQYVSDSSGTTCDLTYNHDSSAYLLHTHFAHYDPSGPESQCIEVDFQLNQTNVYYYPRWYKGYMTSMLTPDGQVLSSGIYNYAFPGAAQKQIATYKLDSNFSVVNESFYTAPDTTNQVGHIMVDYYHPEIIYSGGTHNFQIGIWVPGPSWVAIARMNEQLEIESEKYIGGNETFEFKTLTATPDSGVVITATYYNYASQSYERDVIILKLQYEDFISVGENEIHQLDIKSAIVYPNPGGDQLFIRTTLPNTTFSLYDITGNQLIEKQIIQNITNINVSSLHFGQYFWNISDCTQILESGRWIKTK